MTVHCIGKGVKMGELLSNQLFLLFVIIGIGYLVGSIKVKEINFGASGILLVAMAFGHFGYELVAAVQNIGIACFITAVGLIAGPKFVNLVVSKS